MNPWVITPCRASRVDELLVMLDSIKANPEQTVVITTLPDALAGVDLAGRADHLLTFQKPGMLFGEWFNLGFEYIAQIAGDEPYEVMCIGSSLIGGQVTTGRLATVLRDRGLTMVGPDVFNRVTDVEIVHKDEHRSLHNRILANCFMVAGELGLRFDPQFRWWYSDDDLEMQARELGPVGNVAGAPITMTHPEGHYLSEEQARWATEDRARFVSKWKKEPW